MNYYSLFVHLFHIFFVGGLFLYVGIYRNVCSKYIFNLLFTLGIIILFYHTYKAYVKISKNINPWVNLFHICIIAPIILLIGYNGKDTKRFYFEFILMLAFASIGYHLYYIFYTF